MQNPQEPDLKWLNNPEKLRIFWILVVEKYVEIFDPVRKRSRLYCGGDTFNDVRSNNYIYWTIADSLNMILAGRSQKCKQGFIAKKALIQCIWAVFHEIHTPVDATERRSLPQLSMADSLQSGSDAFAILSLSRNYYWDRIEDFDGLWAKATEKKSNAKRDKLKKVAESVRNEIMSWGLPLWGIIQSVVASVITSNLVGIDDSESSPRDGNNSIDASSEASPEGYFDQEDISSYILGGAMSSGDYINDFEYESSTSVGEQCSSLSDLEVASALFEYPNGGIFNDESLTPEISGDMSGGVSGGSPATGLLGIQSNVQQLSHSQSEVPRRHLEELESLRMRVHLLESQRVEDQLRLNFVENQILQHQELLAQLTAQLQELKECGIMIEGQSGEPGKRPREGHDRAYWFKVRAGTPKEFQCLPGTVVGVYRDGVGAASTSVDVLFIAVAASDPGIRAHVSLRCNVYYSILQ